MPAATLAARTSPHGAPVQCTSWEEALQGWERATWVIVCARLGPRLSFHSSSAVTLPTPRLLSLGAREAVSLH